MDVKVDSTGDIWVLDASTHTGVPRVVHYSPGWEYQNSFPVAASPAVNAFFIRPANAAFLSIARAGGQIVLSWPTNALGFLLQQNDDLATTNWTSLSDTNRSGAIILSATNMHSFFRLKSGQAD